MNTPTQQTGGEAATPRTDDAMLCADEFFDRGYQADEWAVPAEFARQLERETATLHAQIARMKQREGELVGALEMFDKCVFPLGAMNHGCEAFARRTAALQSVAKEGEQ